ncbi:MAG: nicotinate-nucleotide diphosphorylase (carboxylating), partial [Anaerolineae bacterium]|nr:nicotinate-nucleotide diphosphorylase (carboxylating) [Anaerolineae bacterium]
MIDPTQLETIVQCALEEDIGQGDVTSQWTLPPDLAGHGVFLAKAEGILAGLAVAEAVFKQVSSNIDFAPIKT